MNTPHSILIIDEQEMLRRGINSILKSMAEFNVIADVSSGFEALTVVRSFKPRLVLMDLKLNDLDGVELIRQIKNISPDTNIVVFTAYQDNDHIIQSLEAGAISYLLKDTHSDHLTEALLYAAKGETVLHPAVATRVLNLLIGNGSGNNRSSSDLTKRETEVLKLIASGMNNQEIADALVISVSTAKAHVSNILGKLQLSDRTQAAAYAWETGLMQRSL